MRFGSSNVVYRKMFNGIERDGTYEACTYKGVTLKLLFFLLMTLVGAGAGIALCLVNADAMITYLAFSGILTFIFSICALVSVNLSKVFGSLYCVCEGMLVGVISLLCAALFEGAVTAALLSTLAVFGVVVCLFVSNIVKVNNKFLKFLTIFAISFIVVTLLLMIASLFGFEMSFGLTLTICAVSIFLATLYLFFDLENIRQVVEGQFPKKYEWFAAFGLAFTLIWLYVEILRLCVIIASKFNRD